ncbi:MAG: UMP kinase [Candidatus Woesearchaeota archaeon]
MNNINNINKKKNKYIILSLGGSLIVPDKPDEIFLKNFKDFVLSFLNEKYYLNYSFVIICGGGKTNFYYNEAAKKISSPSKKDLDLIGISATKLNAEFVRAIFGEMAFEKIITSPNSKILKNINRDSNNKNNKNKNNTNKNNKNKKIYIVSGWKPGNSSDYVSVLIAKNLNADRVFNLTNVDYVYDKDPKKFSDAKKIEKITWQDYRKIIGNEWLPRMNSPFDPIASKEAEKLKLKVYILNGRNLENLKRAIEKNDFIGTLIE